MTIVIKIFLYIIFFSLLLSLWGFYLALYPAKHVSDMTPRSFNVPYEEVSFYTEDKIKIYGWFIKSPKPKAKTIILLHGYPADKGNILASRLFLYHDYNLLLFDFRALGQSEGAYSTLGKNEVLDLLAAIKYLERRGIEKVGIWGFSLGGAVALMAAEKTPAIAAVVAESSFARLQWMSYEYYHLPILRYALGELTRLWGWLFLGYDLAKISPEESAKKLSIPVLILHSKQDEVISFRHAESLQKALSHNPNASFYIIDNLKHGETVNDYQKIVKPFFDKNL